MSYCETELEYERNAGELGFSRGGVGIEAGPKLLEESMFVDARVDQRFGIEAERVRVDWR